MNNLGDELNTFYKIDDNVTQQQQSQPTNSTAVLYILFPIMAMAFVSLLAGLCAAFLLCKRNGEQQAKANCGSNSNNNDMLNSVEVIEMKS